MIYIDIVEIGNATNNLLDFPFVAIALDKNLTYNQLKERLKIKLKDVNQEHNYLELEDLHLAAEELFLTLDNVNCLDTVIAETQFMCSDSILYAYFEITEV